MHDHISLEHVPGKIENEREATALSFAMPVMMSIKCAQIQIT